MVHFRLNVGVLVCRMSGWLLGLFAQLVVGCWVSLCQAWWRRWPAGQLVRKYWNQKFTTEIWDEKIKKLTLKSGSHQNQQFSSK